MYVFFFFQIEDHCSQLETNIAAAQQRFINDEDTWMDDDQDNYDLQRHVCLFILS